PGHQVLHRAGGDDLSRRGDGQDPRRGVYRDAAEVVAPDLALPRVHAGADLEAERGGAVDDRRRAVERARGCVEARQEAVPRGLRLAAAKALELATHEGVVRIEEITPRALTELGGPPGRSHDVREEEGGEDAVDVVAAADAGHELLDLVDHR